MAKHDIKVFFVDFESVFRERVLNAGPIEVAMGRFDGNLFCSESYFPSMGAQRAWRTPGFGKVESVLISKAIRAFEQAKGKTKMIIEVKK